VSRTRTVVFTIGHGTRSIDDFVALMQGAGVRRLVDVRTAPGSRKHPQFGKDALAEALAAHGIAYRWERDLGGFRKPRADSRHTALRNAGFRGYADHMETEPFRTARDRLVRTAREAPTVCMCAESLWWRCHRRLLADSLTAASCDVLHVMEGGRTEPHRLTGSARVEDSTPVYDVPEQQQELLGD